MLLCVMTNQGIHCTGHGKLIFSTSGSLCCQRHGFTIY